MMADDGLKDPVTIQASRIDATLLPKIFSQPYMLYVIQQGTDLGNVAGKANEAGQGAHDAQVKNDEQDVTLAQHAERISAAESTLISHGQRISAAEAELSDHELRITSAEAELSNHEGRITANEAELADHESRISQGSADVTDLKSRMSSAESDIDEIQGNYISKATSSSQSVQASGGSLLVGNITTPTTDKLQVGGAVNATSYKVAGNQVVGARRTGWTASVGSAWLGAFNSDASFPIGATYSQSEIQTMADALLSARRRIRALEDAMRAHGLIN